MSKLSQALVWSLVLGLFLVVVLILLPFFSRSSYTKETARNTNSLAAVVVKEEKKVSTHLPTPKPLKAIYMTSCVASTPRLRESLKKMVETTELNAVVIDIKDSTGTITFIDPTLQNGGGLMGGCRVGDLREFIESLHASNIYVIGRIAVFQDLYYTAHNPTFAVKKASSGEVWRDYKGLAFVDVGAREYWDYVVRLSLASYDLGFDELNFDYVRYPSDGNMKDTKYGWTASSTTKSETLRGFFAYLHTALKGDGLNKDVPVTSVDLFGMTTTVNNDMNIGQVLEFALPYFDYVAPMVYPSHYPTGWSGMSKPAEKPYEVIRISMKSAVEREQAWRIKNGVATSTPSKMRPWLQDFNLGAIYTPEMVRAQMQASYDVGLDSWMLWNAANRYTSAALLSE